MSAVLRCAVPALLAMTAAASAAPVTSYSGSAEASVRLVSAIYSGSAADAWAEVYLRNVSSDSANEVQSAPGAAADYTLDWSEPYRGPAGQYAGDGILAGGASLMTGPNGWSSVYVTQYRWLEVGFYCQDLLEVECAGPIELTFEYDLFATSRAEATGGSATASAIASLFFLDESIVVPSSAGTAGQGGVPDSRSGLFTLIVDGASGQSADFSYGVYFSGEGETGRLKSAPPPVPLPAGIGLLGGGLVLLGTLRRHRRKAE